MDLHPVITTPASDTTINKQIMLFREIVLVPVLIIIIFF
jgi:hypothetical protein